MTKSVAVSRTDTPSSPAIWQSMRREMDKLFDQFSDGFTFPSLSRVENLWPSLGTELASLAIDVTEDDKAYKVTAELPGLEEKDVNVTVNANQAIRTVDERVFGANSVIWDPEAVRACVAAGVGNEVRVAAGGKVDRHAPPLDVAGRVEQIHDGKYVEDQPRHGGRPLRAPPRDRPPCRRRSRRYRAPAPSPPRADCRRGCRPPGRRDRRPSIRADRSPPSSRR